MAPGTSITQETVWNKGPGNGATGGGVSGFFALPPYQEGLQVKKTSGVTQELAMRGVPDVCGDADPQPDTMCGSMARIPSSAEPAPWRRCGPV